MCRVLEVSRSGYYAWRDRGESLRSKTNRSVVIRIRAIHRESRRSFGSPRVADQLKKEGRAIGRHRVAKLMRLEGIQARKRRRYVATTDSAHDKPVAKNLLARNFEASAPNLKWVGDVTYIATSQGWLYLAVVIDLYSRLVVGWAMNEHIGGELSTRALSMACDRRGTTPAGLLYHSDRGVEYACEQFQQALREHHMVCSMSRKGNCWDNAPAESFFSTLKTELIQGRVYADHREAKTAVFDYIETFYNQKRTHSYLGYQTPVEFERAA